MTEGDSAWIGLDMETHPGALREGYYAKGENVRCDNGRLRSRGGHQMTTFTNTSVNSHNPVTLGTVYGVCTFSDPNGTNTGAVLACANNAYLIYPGQAPITLAYPDGETVSQSCILQQDFDDVYIFRGAGFDTLAWKTAESGTLFKAVVEDGTSSYAFPNADFGGSFENRLYVNDGKDTLYLSNIIAPTVLSTDGRFFINDGSDDRLVNAVPFTKQRLVVFKDQSIHVIDSSANSLADYSIQLITRDTGLLAPQAVANVGAEMYFLAQDGVRTLNQIDDTRFEAYPEPISKPIKPIIDNINFSAAVNAKMAYIDNRLFIAIPTGADTLNKTVLVYNFTNQAWESIDSSEFDVAYFVKLDFSGRRRLFGVSKDGRIFHYDYDFDCADYQDTTTTNAVTVNIETRGYSMENNSVKRKIRGTAVVASWNPTLTIGAVADGVNEVFDSITGHTKSRTAYETYSTTAWDPTNTNDDFENPYRQDYSIAPGNGSGILLQSGLKTNLMQEFTYGFSTRGIARATQVRVKSTSGRIELRGTDLTQTGVTRRRINV